MKLLPRTLLLSLLAAGACDDGGGADGGEPGDGDWLDPDVDAPSDVVQRARVQVLSRDGLRTPLEGVEVAFVAPDGELTAMETTDADGRVSSPVHPDSTVLAFLDDEVRTTLAVVGVQPGDALELGDDHAAGSDATMSMNLALPYNEDATSHWAYTRCGGYSNDNDPTIPIDFGPSCGDGPFSYVGVAMVGFTAHWVAGTGVAMVADDTHEVDLVWAPVPKRDVHVVEPPSEVSYVQVDHHRVRLGGDELETTMIGMVAQALAGDTTIAVPRMDGTDETMLDLRIVPQDDMPGSQQTYAAWRATDDAAWTVNLSDVLLPWLSQPAYDRAARRISWTASDDGDWDATHAVLTWNDIDTFGELRVVAPPGATTIDLPPFPADLADRLPGESAALVTTVYLVDTDEHDGWDAARAAGTLPDIPLQRVPGQTGTLRVSQAGSDI